MQPTMISWQSQKKNWKKMNLIMTKKDSIQLLENWLNGAMQSWNDFMQSKHLGKFFQEFFELGFSHVIFQKQFSKIGYSEKISPKKVIFISTSAKFRFLKVNSLNSATMWFSCDFQTWFLVIVTLETLYTCKHVSTWKH